MIKKAIIPAAGLGTRFYPITKTFPKEMLPIVDTPNLAYIIDECINANILEVILIISSNKKMIQDYFDQDEVSSKIKISYVYQDKPKGLGHAILLAKDKIGKEDFAVLLGDDMYVSNIPAIMQLINDYNKKKSLIVGAMHVKDSDRPKYGMIDAKLIDNKLFKMNYILEKPEINETNSNLAASGRYILTNDIFNYLEDQEIGKDNEIQLTDAIERLNKEKNSVYTTLIEGKRFDIGSKIGFIKANIYFANKSEELKEELNNYIIGIK